MKKREDIFGASPISRRFFLTGILIGGASIMLAPAQALATEWTSLKSVTSGGVTYSFQSGLDTGSKPSAYTKLFASKSMTANAMKAQACMVRYLDNAIIASSAWKGNAQGSSVSASVTISYPGVGYRSMGKVQCAGVTYRCSSTSTGYSLGSSVSQNDSGQTLGTYDDVEKEVTPELILVIADNGATGYVYWDQFSSPGASSSLTVYAADGITPIGVFTFGDK